MSECKQRPLMILLKIFLKKNNYVWTKFESSFILYDMNILNGAYQTPSHFHYQYMLSSIRADTV